MPAVDLHRARRTLEAARFLATGGFSADAVTRAYYAAFQAAQVALEHAGASAATHKGVHTQVHNVLVRPGHLPAEAARNLTRLSTLRQTADYDDGALLTAEHASDALQMADTFIAAVAAWLDANSAD